MILSDSDGPKRAITLSDKDVLRHARLAVISTMRRRLDRRSMLITQPVDLRLQHVTIAAPVRVWNGIICALSTSWATVGSIAQSVRDS